LDWLNVDLSFAWPAVALLLPLPWLAWRYLQPRSDLQSSALRLPIDADWVPKSSSARQSQASRFDLLWMVAVWLLLILALSRPQLLGPPVAIERSGRDLMLAVDTSDSMAEADFELLGQRVDRLTAVQAIAGDFIRERSEDRVGLILFGDIPYLQSPLTFDHASLVQLLNEAFVGIAGARTAIGDSIAMAVKTLQKQPTESRVLILLTDGTNTSGTLMPDAATKLAKDIGLKIYTIGIGQDPDPTTQQRLRDLMSGSSYADQFFNRFALGNPIDEETLQMIADETGGQYFRARETKELSQIYQEIDELEQRTESGQFLRREKDLFFWPAALSLLMLTSFLLTRHTRFNWRQPGA